MIKKGDLKSVMIEVTDIFSIIRRNYSSISGLRDDKKRRDLEEKITILLNRLSKFRNSNSLVLSHILNEVGRNLPNDSIDSKLDFILQDKYQNSFCGPDNEFHEIIHTLIDIREYLDEISEDLIKIDYKIFERLQLSLSRRIRVMEYLNDPTSEKISKERFAELSSVYKDLIDELDIQKNELQILREGLNQK